MRPVWKGLALAGVIAGLIVAAVALVRQDVFAERALPALETQRDQITRITIRHQQNTIGFRKDQEGVWLVSTAGDAPVRPKLIETLIDDLADMRVAKRDENAPPLPARLDGASAYAIALADGEGKGLALFALQREDGMKDGQALLAEEGGAPRLVSHAPALTVAAEDWAEVALPTLSPERVRILRVMTPDARLATFERSDARSDFRRVEADAGVPVEAGAVREAVETLGSLRSEKVRAANQLAWGGATMVLAETFDGVALTLLGARDGANTWVRVNAHYQAPPAPEGAADEAQAEPNDKAAAEAEKLNRMRAFAFLLPPETAARLFGVTGS